MNKAIKTLALITATIGLAAVVKRVRKQSYSAIDDKSVTTILANGGKATLMHQNADGIEMHRLVKAKLGQ
ncbi:hypothetical protein ACNMZ4_06845 [Aerococcus urinaeequi]|uniref:hypothetical protein n=1 Tax=Aerococcus urinaeequi TaxID=51665 RepID=UPI003AAB3BE0